MFRSDRFAALRGFAVLLAVALLFALLAAVACGDGDEDAGETPAAAETPEAGETPAADDGDEDEDGDGAGLQELEALAAEWANSSAKVSYDFSSSFDSEVDSGSMTLYWRPPDWRVDISSTDGADVTMIAADDTTYLCSEGSCLAIESTESPMVPPFPFLGSFTEAGALSTSIAEAALGVDIDHSQENIAGESASCFSVSGSVAGGAGDVEWCFTDDGILLRFASTSEDEIGAGDFTLEATEVSRDLSDSDFEPPFPVEEFEIPDLEDLIPAEP